MDENGSFFGTHFSVFRRLASILLSMWIFRVNEVASCPQIFQVTKAEYS